MPEELKELIVGLTQAIEKLNVLADQNIELNKMAMPMVKKMLPVCEKIFGAMEPYGDALAAILRRQLGDDDDQPIDFNNHYENIPPKD